MAPGSEDPQVRPQRPTFLLGDPGKLLGFWIYHIEPAHPSMYTNGVSSAVDVSQLLPHAKCWPRLQGRAVPTWIVPDCRLLSVPLGPPLYSGLCSRARL